MYNDRKEKYMENFRKFLDDEIGNEEKQKEYLASFKKFQSERREFQKNFTVKINGLISVSGW